MEPVEPLRTTSSHSPDAVPGAAASVQSIARLLSAALGGDTAAVCEALTREARMCCGADITALVHLEPGSRRAYVVASDPDAGTSVAFGDGVPLEDHPALADVVDRRLRLMRLDGGGAGELAPLLGRSVPAALLLPLIGRSGPERVLILARDDVAGFTSAQVDLAAAFADAATGALAQVGVVEEQRRQAAQQSALARAAKSLIEVLDLETVMGRICHEAVTIMDGDVAVIYKVNGPEELTIVAAQGFPPEQVGFRMAAGNGLAGKVLRQGQAMLTNDYQRIANLEPGSPFEDVHAAVAVPMIWDGQLNGVLSVGYSRPRDVTRDDMALLETFAELAAVGCANASAHAGLALAARTDGLTGCLNHAALHDGLRREVERAIRHDAAPISLILFDLDDFKQVNERHGHLAGDEVLRRAGHALRYATRPYDLAARYGGDEFALLAVDADESAALEIAQRAVERIRAAIEDVSDDDGGTAVTAGVAQWNPGVTPTELIARADRALLYGKQLDRRGLAVTFSEVDELFRPGRFNRHEERRLPTPPPMPSHGLPDSAGRSLDERLRKRTRQLALANELGARLSAMTTVDEIAEATVEELHRAFGYALVAVVRVREDDWVEAAALRGAHFTQLLEGQWSQPREVGLVGRCLRERRPVLAADVTAEPDYNATEETSAVRSEMVVPLWVGDQLYGALNCEEIELGAFDGDDLMLLQTIADQVGSAMRSAQLYERLERAYLGTAEALAAALEAKDAYTADHARSIVEQAESVGRVLGMNENELRDLRFGAVFHDIGKIAVPEHILNKPGPLDPEERVIMERHTVVGEQILAPVEFLAGVRRLVRHEHERFDGRGYPDGLAGEDIPLGARIILACDALHAMTSDRPYRRAMTLENAVAELTGNAGTQFDPRVVRALLEVLDDAPAAA